jgi:hypothetical protein
MMEVIMEIMLAAWDEWSTGTPAAACRTLASFAADHEKWV